MDNAELDKAILRAVNLGERRFSAIIKRALMELDPHMAVSLDDRRFDRRLQSLRKRGELTYDSKSGWTVPKKD